MEEIYETFLSLLYYLINIETFEKLRVTVCSPKLQSAPFRYESINCIAFSEKNILKAQVIDFFVMQYKMKRRKQVFRNI